MLFNQLKNGFLWNSNFWKIIFYAFQILKRKFLCFSPTWKSYFMVFSLHFRVLNLYFFVFVFWQHQHHQQRNENDFSTWVSLSILLLCSVYHIFHKRNENEFSTWAGNDDQTNDRIDPILDLFLQGITISISIRSDPRSKCQRRHGRYSGP